MHDIAIRGATIVDGTGSEPFVGDIAIQGDRIVGVDKTVGPARRDIAAEGRIATPGWVDIHSHYDGQATWDPLMSPSAAHGVTTTVMGNCGVGFAPARPDQHDWLINLMEGVEDMPGTALAEGIDWRWETFPEYLDALDAMPRVIDVAALVPHSAVRAYVMGEREAIREPAAESELEQMSQIVRDAVAAGAIGLSTSRTKLHLAADGSPVPGSFAEIDELAALGNAVREGGGGFLQLVTDWTDPERDFDWICSLGRSTAMPISYTLVQLDDDPDQWRTLLALNQKARSEGLNIHAGVGARPVGMLINLESRIHPFSNHPSYSPLISLPLEEKLRRMRDPELRRKLLEEEPEGMSRWWQRNLARYDCMFALGNPPNYEPAPAQSIAAIAAREGRRPLAVIYDMMVAGDGNDWIYFPMINYADGDFGPLHAMLTDPGTILSLADGGAHCGMICDASTPTYMLTHWARDRQRGPRLSLAQAVHLQTGQPAATWGFADRGRIAPGLRADINIIDFENLALDPPRWAADLPAGGKRLLQDARGYDFTLCAGKPTWESGEHTGALPGRLFRAGAANQ